MSHEIPKEVLAIAQAVQQAGGLALLVGGYVRDTLLGIDSKDYDIEVYGLSLEELESLLSQFGTVMKVGRAFGVLRIKSYDIDISLPRKDSKTSAGHRGFVVDLDPHLSFADAALRRDLTVNSMGMDPLTFEVIDPHGGQLDLKSGVLRATDADSFCEDPLRGLRVAQFAARFDLRPNDALINICRNLDLSELPAERLYWEFHKLLLKGTKPSLGLQFLRDSELLRFFKPIEALIDVPQDARWHPEGDVWVHTLMCLDVAATLRTGVAFEDEVLMFGVLCHDFGKPATTTQEADGRIRSIMHEDRGVQPTLEFLQQLKVGNKLCDAICKVVRCHLRPSQFVQGNAGQAAYRRLARELSESGVTMTLLERVARADALGRTTPNAQNGIFPNGDSFLSLAQQASVLSSPTQDVVQGRHLIERGYQPGPNFGALLRACRNVQDETGLEDANEIIARALQK